VLRLDVVLRVLDCDMEDLDRTIDVGVAVGRQDPLSGARGSRQGVSAQVAVREPWIVSVRVTDAVEGHRRLPSKM
jgi:hypothetical protein